MPINHIIYLIMQYHTFFSSFFEVVHPHLASQIFHGVLEFLDFDPFLVKKMAKTHKSWITINRAGGSYYNLGGQILLG